MGNNFCPPDNAANVAAIARDVCPFPNYSPNLLYSQMQSVNSSLQLRHHYRAVQSSLNPQQLDDFTKNLRTIFGRQGKVTLGGLGVVALSLAVLFDTLAKQAKGEWVSDSEPIPGLFVKDLKGYYPPQVYTISEYLRLVPHIANNPTRMREETERYFKQLISDDEWLDKLGENHTVPITEDITLVNLYLGNWFTHFLEFHLFRINGTVNKMMPMSGRSLPDEVIYNLNCDPEAADKDFLAQVQNSDSSTQEAFQKYLERMSDKKKLRLLQIVKLEFGYSIFPYFCAIGFDNSMTVEGKDFDLKANALGRWA